MKTKYSSRVIFLCSFVLASAMLFTSCNKESLQEVKESTTNNELLREEVTKANAILSASAKSISSVSYFGYGCSGPYVIQSMAHPELNLVLDVPNSNRQNGVVIQQYPYNGGENQKWYVCDGNTGYIRITNMASGLALDLPNGSFAFGVKIQQYQMNFGLNQDWIFTITGPITGESGNIAVGTIRSRKSGLALTVPNASTAPGVQIEQWVPSLQKSQTWRFIRLMYLNDFWPK